MWLWFCIEFSDYNWISIQTRTKIIATNRNITFIRAFKFRWRVATTPHPTPALGCKILQKWSFLPFLGLLPPPPSLPLFGLNSGQRLSREVAFPPPYMYLGMILFVCEFYIDSYCCFEARHTEIIWHQLWDLVWNPRTFASRARCLTNAPLLLLRMIKRYDRNVYAPGLKGLLVHVIRSSVCYSVCPTCQVQYLKLRWWYKCTVTKLGL